MFVSFVNNGIERGWRQLNCGWMAGSHSLELSNQFVMGWVSPVDQVHKKILRLEKLMIWRVGGDPSNLETDQEFGRVKLNVQNSEVCLELMEQQIFGVRGITKNVGLG